YEEQHVLLLFIAEVLSNRKTCQSNASTGPWWLVHLAVHQGSFIDNSGLVHFIVKVAAFTSTLAYAGENGKTTVLSCDVVDEFHDQNGLTYTRTTEETNLSTLQIRSEQVDNFNPGVERLSFRRQIRKLRSFSV